MKKLPEVDGGEQLSGFRFVLAIAIARVYLLKKNKEVDYWYKIVPITFSKKTNSTKQTPQLIAVLVL